MSELTYINAAGEREDLLGVTRATAHAIEAMRKGDRKTLVFNRATGVCESEAGAYLGRATLNRIERTLLRRARDDAQRSLAWQSEAIAEAERKKIYWRNRMTTLDRRLAALPDPAEMDDEAAPHGLMPGKRRDDRDLLSAMGYEGGEK
jgi:hypothetical protein